MQTKPFAALALAIGALLPAAVYAQSVTQIKILPTPHLGGQHGQRGQRVMGQVTDNTNGSITLTPRLDPTPVTFTLAPNARITQTMPSSLTDVQANDAVRADGTVSADGTSIDAKRLTIMPAAPAGRAAQANTKHVTGSVSSVSPLKITEANGTIVTVNTTPTTRVFKLTAADATAITVGSRITAMLVGPDTARVARQVTILPMGRARHKKTAAL